MLRTLIVLMTLVSSSPTLAAVVARADFAGFAGRGLAPGGGDGRLDSLTWSVHGFSDGDTAFGDLAITGDFARGLAEAPVRTGGLYAFALPGSAIGVGAQPTSGDFTPGGLVWQVVNHSALEWTELELAFELWVRNDGARSSEMTVDVALAADAALWLDVAAAARATPEDSGDPAWRLEPVRAALPLSALAPADALWLRFGFSDGAGSGGRDEFALTALTLEARSHGPQPPAVGAPPAIALLLAPMLLLARSLAGSDPI